MQDAIIKTLAIAANDPGFDAKVEVVLVVSGFLISGEVISHRQFCEEHSISRPFANLYDELLASQEANQQESSTEGDGGAVTATANTGHRPPHYIHLRNAQYYSGANNQIPAKPGVSVRIKIDSVHAFSFGRIQNEKPAI